MVKMLKPQLARARTQIVRPMQSRSQQARIRGGNWMVIRDRVLARDAGLCLVCQAHGRVTLASEVDHRVRLEDGGSNDDANLQSLCHGCHAQKSAREVRGEMQ